jgi:hypothetical protein
VPRENGADDWLRDTRSTVWHACIIRSARLLSRSRCWRLGIRSDLCCCFGPPMNDMIDGGECWRVARVSFQCRSAAERAGLTITVTSCHEVVNTRSPSPDSSQRQLSCSPLQGTCSYPHPHRSWPGRVIKVDFYTHLLANTRPRLIQSHA